MSKFGDLGGIRDELDALAPQTNSAVFEAPLSALDESAQQLRIDMREEGLNELADSMASVGLVQPIAVADIGGGRYMIVAGHRRVAAAKALGWEKIPANIVEDKGAATLALEGLIENIQREDLAPLELALAIDRAMAVSGTKASDFAKMIGKTPVWLSKARALLSLPQEVLDALALSLSPQERRRLGLDALAELSRVEDEELCVSLFARLRSGEIGRDEMREEIRRAKTAPVVMESVSGGVAVATFGDFGFMDMGAEETECERVFETSFAAADIVESEEAAAIEYKPVVETSGGVVAAESDDAPEAVLRYIEQMNEAQLLKLQEAVAARLAKLEKDTDEFSFSFEATADARKGVPYVAKLVIKDGKLDREFFDLSRSRGAKSGITVYGDYKAKAGDILEIREGGSWKNDYRYFYEVSKIGELVKIGSASSSSDKVAIERRLKNK